MAAERGFRGGRRRWPVASGEGRRREGGGRAEPRRPGGGQRVGTRDEASLVARLPHHIAR
jgi:hypothetical protein